MLIGGFSKEMSFAGMMGKLILMTVIGLFAFILAGASKNSTWKLILYAVFGLIIVLILTMMFGELV